MSARQSLQTGWDAEIRRLEADQVGCRNRVEALARRQVVDGTLLLEELVRQNISLDQADAITGAPEYDEIQRLFVQVLARSGELPAFHSGGRRKRRAMQRTVAQAIRKFADPDDRQTRFLRIENLPKRLGENPGDRELGRRIARARRLVEDYRNIHISPRARPTLFQDSAGFWDAIITGFTQEGELLVRVDMPVMYASGNNTDRVQEQVKAEIVRRCVRHGFDEGLDGEAKRNSRDPLSRIDAMRAYDLLKLRFPLLRRIEEPGVMKALLEDARGGGDSRLRERIAELEADERRLLELHRPPESTYDEP